MTATKTNKYAANRIVVLTDEQIKYLKYLLNDRYEDIVEPDATEIKPEEYTIVETHDVLEAALSDNKQRSIIEWHKYPEELPPNYGYYLIKEETGNVAVEHFGAYGFKDSIGILCWANPIEVK